MVRPVCCPSNTFNPQILEIIHNDVYGKPYDLYLKDWLKALIPIGENTEPTISRFWCSALIGYIYTKCGILDPFTSWSFLRPSDFSAISEHLKFVDDDMSLDAERKIL